MSEHQQSDDLLRRTMAHAQTYLHGLADSRVAATASLEQLRARLHTPLPRHASDPAAVIDQLVSDTADGLVGSGGGRFFAWVIGGTLPAALAADWLTSTWDQNAAIHACSPAEAVIEEVCGAWLKELLGLPAQASFALTTGSQMAHTTALAAARHALLARRGWDVEALGLHGAPRIRIITSDQHHGSIARSARLLGFGTAAITVLASDADGKLAAPALLAALEREPATATIVALQAGDLNTGAFDDFATLIPLARSRGAWVHIDGAFGLWAASSASLRHLTAGLEQADSWVTDGHKWLNVPYDCGYVFVADSAAHFGATSHRESYMIDVEGARDQIDWSLEWSRRGRGVATYAALRQLGQSGVADLIERTCRHARALVAGIGALAGAQVVWSSQVNQGLVRFLDSRAGAGEDDHDRFTDAVVAAITDGGEAFFGGTTWRGRRCMRVSVCNWRTGAADVERTVRAVARVLAAMRQAG
ncbi:MULTISPECIES: pyridoxal phosphate-dependent decarboxylase family protein [unclassified Janthinobacterium]|uniref:pyridoxal phosphate-dependent decarboxylase family protein n=1 Tax=unclassified Janthinobacterium TaxID=2610881 RepID=UPI00034ABE48|nr:MULTISPECIES: aminotransferase class V-fold PLP-dependent enzyme [unclassified Janthinobacterium]MEC5161182.1 glutamate/tyrosine decarboxylase-like PLP-dependent enzyme [Janthinobacterium sp. CG_S6]